MCVCVCVCACACVCVCMCVCVCVCVWTRVCACIYTYAALTRENAREVLVIEHGCWGSVHTCTGVYIGVGLPVLLGAVHTGAKAIHVSELHIS